MKKVINVKGHNEAVESRKELLNQELEDKFNKRVAEIKKYRRLKKVS